MRVSRRGLFRLGAAFCALPFVGKPEPLVAAVAAPVVGAINPDEVVIGAMTDRLRMARETADYYQRGWVSREQAIKELGWA